MLVLQQLFTFFKACCSINNYIVALYIEVSLTEDYRGIIYNRNMFIVQVTDLTITYTRRAGELSASFQLRKMSFGKIASRQKVLAPNLTLTLSLIFN
jgi:hypothetical protein